MVTMTNRGSAAVITLENPPVNGLSDAVRRGIAESVEQALADPHITALVLVGSGTGFCGGADIRQFNTPAATAEPTLAHVIAALEASPKPVIAAIHGFALGGGLELALGAHVRIAHRSAKLGLPEVTLGLIPGAGGTQRLPRLIGARAALDIVTSGVPVPAARALELGIVTELFDGDPTEAGLACAERLRGTPVAAAPAAAAGADFAAARSGQKRNRRNRRAVLAAIDAVEQATRLPLAQGLAYERQRFDELVAGPESKALRYQFFAEKQAAKIPGITAQTPTRELRSIAVIGSGTMGTGIAMAAAESGLPVTVIDTNPQALERAQQRIAQTYAQQVDRGRLSAADAAARQSAISCAGELEAARGAELVIEAVFEDLEVKCEVFAALDALAADGAILATNTSRLDVNAIAQATNRPHDVLGMHFFSPANVMRLLEVVQGQDTAPEVLATVIAFAKSIGKVPVLSQVADGFIGNRMLGPYRQQADLLLEAGATPAQVDGALEAFGFAMGPCAVADLAGIDIGEAGRVRRRAVQTAVEAEADSFVGTRLFEAGRLGQKTGAGYYRYPDGRTRHDDPAALEIIRRTAAERGVVQREVSDAEIVERCLLALVNEGARLLGEGVAQRASDIDVVYANGYGFPVYKGGPMYWAEQQGLDWVLERLRTYCDTLGRYWEPAPLLVDAVGAASADASPTWP